MSRTEKIVGVVLAAILITGLGWFLRGTYRLGELDAAIAVLHNLNTLESQYSRAQPDVGFTCNFDELRKTGSNREPLISGDIHAGRRHSGYSFQVLGCADERPNPRYRIEALAEGENIPLVCTDQSGEVKYGEAPSICQPHP